MILARNTIEVDRAVFELLTAGLVVLVILSWS
jgi:hypothetical protein